MKTMNFKMYPLMIAAFALFAFSGCDGTTGISSDSGIGIIVPDAVTSTVEANPTSVASDGTETSTVTVTVNDANTNPITDATVTLEQTGSSTISDVTNVGDGTYTFDVNSTTAETVTYTATADGVPITQTADVTFEVGVADTGTSTVTANPASVEADGTATSTVTVTVNDANANPIADATVTLAQTGSSTISAVTNVGDGTYTFDVNSTTPETVTYTATADGVPITQTADVTFEVGVADAGTSSVTANPASVEADGTTSTVTVTVNDASSNPIADATVTLAQTGASTISAVTNVGDGTYTFDVNSTTPETVTYTATADGVPITQTANVTFTETEAQCLLAAGGYETIVIDGKTWLDKNLGASEVATDTNDSFAYGYLYQFGRSTEGHQERTSDINHTLATTLDNVQNTDWEGKFIVNNTPPRDWVVATVDDDGSLRSQSWSTPYDPNQVCPCGYIVPTEQDFIDLNITADATAADTFKLAYAGWRWYNTGVIEEETISTYLWTNAGSTYKFDGAEDRPGGATERAYGLSIRCIKP